MRYSIEKRGRIITHEEIEEQIAAFETAGGKITKCAPLVVRKHYYPAKAFDYGMSNLRRSY